MSDDRFLSLGATPKATRKFASVVFGALLIVAMLASHSEAGSWQELVPASELPQSQESWEAQELREAGDCTIQFSGPIMPGDLTSALQSGMLNNHIRVCLNSEGGSISEVHRFINQLQVSGAALPTRIRSGDRCWSACAIMFMNGWSIVNPRYAYFEPDAILDVGASLGFHTPFIPENVEAGIATESAFQGGIQMANLLFQATYNEPSFSYGESYPITLSPELVSIILDTPANEMYIINSVGMAELIGVQFSLPGNGNLLIRNDMNILGSVMLNMCISSRAMDQRRRISRRGFQFSDIVNYIYDEFDKIAWLDPYNAASGGIERSISQVQIATIGPEGRKIDFEPPQNRDSNLYVGIVWSDTFETIFGASSRYYCRVELYADTEGQDLRVRSHRVGLNHLQFIEQEGLEASQEIRWVQSFGIVPIESEISETYIIDSAFHDFATVEFLPWSQLDGQTMLQQDFNSFWDHNGSRMGLVADGSRRQFYYAAPRAALVERGVQAGTLLFEGARRGNMYIGEARIFARPPCGEFTYAVEGPVSSDQRSVTMFGRAPRVNERCQVTSYRDDTLVFTLE